MSSQDELRVLIKEAFEGSYILQRHCTEGMEVSSTLDFMISNIYKFGIARLDTVMLLSGNSRAEDCFNILRTAYETHVHLLLMTKGKKYRRTLTYTITPDLGSTPEQAREKAYQKWHTGWKSKQPKYANIVDIQRGGKKDTIIVTYQREGLCSAEDTEKKERPVAMQLFALEDFDPEDAFVSFLPGIVEGDTFFKRESGNDLIQEQKRFYSGHFHIKGLIRNLRINDLITRLQRTRVLVHYSYLSAFTHPTRKAINFGEELRSTMASPADVERLILLYVAKIHELLLSSVIDFYSEVNPKSQLTGEKSLVARLKIATQDLWFIWDEPTEYDKFDSEGRKEIVKQMAGETVDPGLVLYYTNPLKRLVSLRLFQRSRPKPMPSWVQAFLKKDREK